ncbi:MAG: hypothetical protein AB8B65_17170 [Kordia sp.]|uniref:hypothetical protein n=1 Tax=Kordia sp. TaxID=1965332 RepID=UPI00385ED0AA
MTIIVTAQEEDSKQAVLDDITRDACDCITEKSSKKITKKQLEVQLGLCLINSYGKYKKRIDKYIEISLNDPDSLENLGQEIGLNMLTICPDTFMSFAQEYIVDDLEAEVAVVPSKTDLVTGKVQKLTKDQFNMITFEGINKRKYKFLWLEYFEGQELLNDVKKLKKLKVTVTFESVEMYDPKMEDYRTYKVIRKIKAQN